MGKNTLIAIILDNDIDQHKFHLMIVDLLEGLPISNVSSPTNTIPEWNAHSTTHIEAFFEFTNAYLHEDACMLVFHHEEKKSGM